MTAAEAEQAEPATESASEAGEAGGKTEGYPMDHQVATPTFGWRPGEDNKPEL